MNNIEFKSIQYLFSLVDTYASTKELFDIKLSIEVVNSGIQLTVKYQKDFYKYSESVVITNLDESLDSLEVKLYALIDKLNERL